MGGRIVLGAGLAVLGALAMAASCESVAGLDQDFRAAPDAGPPPTDAGAAGDAEAGPGVCVPATYPDPPGIPDDGNDVGPLTVAVYSIDLGDTGNAVGYDLDHVCTCIDDGGPSCAGRASTLSTYCDVGEGVDNQFGKIVTMLEIAIPGFDSAAYSMKAQDGTWSLLVQVTGYNGEKDDPTVQVAIYPCSGLGTTPKWDGTDSWPILQTAVDADGGAAYASNGAYVSDQTLVATVPSVPIQLGGTKQTLTITLSGAVLTGKLVESNGSWRLIQATLAARIHLSDFFQAISTYRDNTGTPLCTDGGFIYSSLKTQVCNSADVLADPTQPISTTCDSISFGMGFTANAALLGPIVMPPALTAGCPPATDPANDSCSP
jgi:hypothetical protein